ncbi:hypothetical protein AB0P17_32420 [Streptomyces sp. NPDC088124]|uniref:hypothetical protein n=1 Tax=Streptomyces sp. NPDC088124 TaxID=3154654 RepID=UPI0034358461
MAETERSISLHRLMCLQRNPQKKIGHQLTNVASVTLQVMHATLDKGLGDAAMGAFRTPLNSGNTHLVYW